jgi:Transposase DDE domain
VVVEGEAAMFFRHKRSGRTDYLQIVKNERVDGKPRQSVVATLGRVEELAQDGTLDRLLRSGARFARSAVVLTAYERGETTKLTTRQLGPALAFERLWRETGCERVIRELAGEREFRFDLERAVFLTVLHRLFDPGSDRAAEKWRHGLVINGAGDLELHQLYRAMGWLGDELPDQSGRGLGPRTTKDLVEERLFALRNNLFSELSLVFLDTTSLYFEGAGGQSLGQYGHSKDHRPDLKQVVLAVVIDSSGRPICSELWPGNTTDVTTLLPVIERLKTRFLIARIGIVADRGMISAATLGDLEARNIDYILGVRERATKEIRGVIADPAPYVPLSIPKAVGRGSTDLLVKEVFRSGLDAEPARAKAGGKPRRRRYIVCRNEAEADKDKAEREAIVAALEGALRRGDKSLVGNRGYRRFLKLAAGRRFEIDPRRVALDAQFDGTYVLRTNTRLTPLQAALRYRDRWMVEDIFRTAKSLLATRPIFHKYDETIRGHVFCSFLALLLRKELEDRLAAAGHAFEWADIVQDLERLSETEIEQDGKRYILRNAAPGCAGTVLRTLGIALPPLIRSAQPPPPTPPRQKPRRRPRRRSANARTAPANTLI